MTACYNHCEQIPTHCWQKERAVGLHQPPILLYHKRAEPHNASVQSFWHFLRFCPWWALAHRQTQPNKQLKNLCTEVQSSFRQGLFCLDKCQKDCTEALWGSALLWYRKKLSRFFSGYILIIRKHMGKFAVMDGLNGGGSTLVNKMQIISIF